jgi:hypothetical protein
MSVSRRRFLRSGAVVSAALVLKPGTFTLGQNTLWSNSPVGSNQKAGANLVHSYRREMFEPFIGDIFRVRVGKQMVDLKLVELTNSTTGTVTGTDCFSLRFHASKPLPGTATTHKLNHSKLGNFDLFMVQSANGTKFLHTAIVNHVV